MVPQADAAHCQDEVALVGAAAVARAAPAHPVVTELVPFRVGGCLLVTAPGRLIVQVGLTLPFVPRLALGSCPSEVVRSPWMSWLMGGPWKRS